MLEAFERHLRTHNISKQFEEAKTKEDKIAVCKKFLEDEGYVVRTTLEMQHEGEKIVDSYPGVLTGGIHSPMGKITIGDMNYDPMTLAIDPSTMGSITVSNLDTFQPIQNQPHYIKAHCMLTENEETSFQDAKNIRLHVMNELTNQLNQALKSFVIDKNLIKSETNYSTLDKHYTVKIGFVE